MKKSLQSLVLLLIALMVPIHALAITDGVNYEPVNGIQIVNHWIQDRAHTPQIWSNKPYCNTSARTAVMYNGYIYIARSNANTVVQGTDTLVQSVIYKVDAANGELVKELPLTLNGAIYGGATLSSNTVGVDNFGHLYMAPFSSNLATTQLVYMVDQETGELTLIGELAKGDALERCDHIDVMGDVTREEAECNIMAVSVSSEYIYRWHAELGGEWEGGFNGVPYLAILDFFPTTVTTWGYGPVVKMKLGEEEPKRYSGELFYIDGFYSSPILYNVTGKMVDSFENVDQAYWPMDIGANGVCEFTLDGRQFIVYAAAQYSGIDETTMVNKACQVYICKLGEGMTLEGMQRYWMVPDELGSQSNGGVRVQSINVEYGVDDEGNEEVTLFIFKCYNGMAVYKLSVIDESALFVLNGIRYKIIGANQVKIEKLEENTGVVEIPETVTYEGVDYQVTNIERGAFRGYCLDLLILPITISSIEPNAFMDCTIQSLFIAGDGAWQGGSVDITVEALFIGSGVTNISGLGINANKIFSYSSTPPVCDESTFSDYDATLYVPAASFAAYFVAPYWYNFGNIVGDAVEPSEVVLNQDSSDLLVNDQLCLTATVSPANATPNTVMWSTTDANVATVDNGQVTAVGPGECDIIASCLNKKALCHITAGVIEVTSIALCQEEAFLEVNEQVSLTATVTPDNASCTTVTWSSTNSTVATVDANGTVWAVGTGECDIIATCGELQAACHVIVVPQKIYITLDKHTAKVLPNHMITLNPTVTPVSTELKVTSTDPTIAAARIVNGVVQVVGITEGTVTITVGSVDGYAIPDTCQVTVYTEIGDVNCDGFVNISDVTDLIDYLLNGNDTSISHTNADCDNDGKVNIADVTTLIDYLLSGRWPWEPDHEWVDLGLPSGTLWATCNVGANSPEEYGNYFAWGETEPKDYYDFSTYKWCNGSVTTMTKYCHNSSYGYNGFVDNKTELDPEDDAAYVNWGEDWRMPTIDQLAELSCECTWTWTTRNGMTGYLVTGPNGSRLFLPAAGDRWDDSLHYAGSGGYYWSRTLYFDFPYDACFLFFNSGSSYHWSNNYRVLGHAVRAVRLPQN